MRILSLVIPILFTAWLSGCAVVAVGAGGEAAVAAVQERTVGDAIDDATILLKIKNLFIQHDTEDLTANVEVKVVEGRVLLTGNVDKPQTQIDAVRFAWQVEGVHEVINEIQISDKAGFMNYAKDVWISAQIRSRLLFEKHIRSINYSVITVNQTVYVMGIAQNQEELNRVTYVCSTTQHVEKVISFVQLKDDPRRNPIY